MARPVEFAPNLSLVVTRPVRVSAQARGGSRRAGRGLAVAHGGAAVSHAAGDASVAPPWSSAHAEGANARYEKKSAKSVTYVSISMVTVIRDRSRTPMRRVECKKTACSDSFQIHVNVHVHVNPFPPRRMAAIAPRRSATPSAARVTVEVIAMLNHFT